MSETGTRTVERALTLLAAVAEDGGTLSQLARAAELSPSTASRLLATLAGHELVRRDEYGRYGPGTRLRQLAAVALRSDPVYELAGPHLAELARETGETANLAVPADDRQVVYLRQAAGPKLVQTASWAGRTIPRRGTALGAALRGAVGDGGYVARAGAVEPDVTSIAAPVYGHDGKIAARAERARAELPGLAGADRRLWPRGRRSRRRVVAEPRGPGAGGGGMSTSTLRCKGWQQEAALRMLENNLHPDVAENPSELVVYGGIGKAARNWPSYHAIVRELQRLGDEETLLVQSGKPVAVFETHEAAPRVLLANSNLVPDWANWDEFRRLDAAGLMMYGQMTAGSWIYIGSQGILQGTYETFAAAARKRFDGSLVGRLVVTAGLGGMGGAQPLSITMLGGTALCVEVDLQRIERRIQTGYLDERAADLDDALTRLDAARREGRALSIGLAGNAAEVVPELVRRGVHVDIVTDQTSAHDPLNGYIPAGLTLEQAEVLRRSDPDEYLRRVGESAVTHVSAIRDLAAAGAEAFDYGNALRGLAFENGDKDAFSYPGFVPAYVRPLFCEGKGPFRWVALSGDPADIHATDRAILDLFGDQEHIARWIKLASERVKFQGLPARICWLGYGERHLAGLRFNEMVASGEVKAPIVIGRDHLDAGSVASPQRETESMADTSDAVADWPLLNALINTACGASWVSIHHGGGVGMGKSIHAGQVCVADGTELAGRRIERVLKADPGMGIVRHVDAGYDLAISAAHDHGLRIPMLESSE